MEVQHKPLVRIVTVKQPQVFMGRNAQKLTAVAKQFKATAIFFEKQDIRHNVASLLGLFSMGIESGDTITVIVDAPDSETAEQAFKAIEKLVA